MERAPFFPNHTGPGCSDQRWGAQCLRCRALYKDQEERIDALVKEMQRNVLKRSERFYPTSNPP